MTSIKNIEYRTMPPPHVITRHHGRHWPQPLTSLYVIITVIGLNPSLAPQSLRSLVIKESTLYPTSSVVIFGQPSLTFFNFLLPPSSSPPVPPSCPSFLPLPFHLFSPHLLPLYPNNDDVIRERFSKSCLDIQVQNDALKMKYLQDGHPQTKQSYSCYILNHSAYTFHINYRSMALV